MMSRFSKQGDIVELSYRKISSTEKEGVKQVLLGDAMLELSDNFFRSVPKNMHNVSTSI